MDDLVSKLETLEAELSEKYRLQGEGLALVRRALAEARALAEPGVQGGGLGGEGIWAAGVEPASNGFMVPDTDDAIREPIYDVRVVRGFGTIRERAYAAATVYGRRLREVALAKTIFETGETSAPDAKSARWSLGSLTRYGDEWIRDKGWLVYQGQLTPNVELIREMYEEIAGGPEYLDGPEFDGEREPLEWEGDSVFEGELEGP